MILHLLLHFLYLIKIILRMFSMVTGRHKQKKNVERKNVQLSLSKLYFEEALPIQ